MNDDPVIPLPPGRAVDIPARFIRQAFEHLQHTGDRYVTFIFAGEMVADAVCYGITTQRPAPVKLITDQRNPDDAPTWTIKSLTNNVILETVQRDGPINTKMICDRLDIARSDIPLRQRVRRALETLVQSRLIRKTGDKRYPDFIAGQRSGRQPGHQDRVGRKRSDITEEMVIAQMQQGPMSSRDIGDRLGIERKDVHLRGRITEVIKALLKQNRARHIAGNMGTGRMYELI
jgi:hypothetical protein